MYFIAGVQKYPPYWSLLIYIYPISFLINQQKYFLWFLYAPSIKFRKSSSWNDFNTLLIIKAMFDSI